MIISLTVSGIQPSEIEKMDYPSVKFWSNIYTQINKAKAKTK